MTDRTPIQFGDDERQLLRQIAGLVQELHFNSQDTNIRLLSLEQKVDALDQKVDSLEQKVDSLKQKVDALDQKVDALEQKVDERLQDTRPIWQQVLADIGTLKVENAAIRSDIGGLKTEFGSLKAETIERLDRMEARISTLEIELRRDVRELSSIVRHSQRDTSRWLGEFEDRIEKLEPGKQ